MVRIKMQAFKELDNTDASGISTMLIDWGDQVNLPVANIIRVQDSIEFLRYKNLYRFFRIQGCRMDYKPYGFNAGSNNIASEELLVGSNLVAGVLNSTNIRLATDFAVRRSNQRHVKYVSVAKSKMKSGGAVESLTPQSTGPWMDTTSPNNYHNGVTKFIVQNLNLPAAQASGMMYVTYYVWFKVQRTDT